jgi:hypothetical protein
MELEVDMRGTVRVGALQPRMSAHSSGALSEGDIVLSIDGNKVSGDNVEDSKALLVGKRATMVAIEVQRGKQTLIVSLKRGSWGPEHATLSTEQAPSAITPKDSGSARPNASVEAPQPANLQAPSSAIPGSIHAVPSVSKPLLAWPADTAQPNVMPDGGLGGAIVQGGYAAARRGQGGGTLATTHE